MMTSRLKQILEVLLRSDATVSVKQLSEEIGLSKRTIQRELETVDKALRPYDLLFVSRAGVGVWLEGTQESKEKLSQEIFSADLYDSGNKDERRKRLILELLREKGLKKLFVYSNQFGVSEATISVDLESAEKWLATYQLTIVRKPGSGIYVAGEERDFRRAICGFLYEHLSSELVQEAYEMPLARSQGFTLMQRSGIAKMLQGNIIERVVASLTAINHVYMTTLTEQAYIGLVIHIAIAVQRILQGETIRENSQWLENFIQDEDYSLAEDMAWSLEETFEIEFSDMEVAYLCLHIKGAKHEQIYYKNAEHSGIDSDILQHLLHDLIYAYDPQKAYLFQQDEEFLQGLLAHLQPTIVRIQYDLEIHNPMLAEIQKNYAPIYQRCENVALVLQKRLGKPIPAAEIGFLTVHFGAALVRAEGKKEQIRPVKIAVVCSSGIGISRLMSSKLEKIFKDRVILTAFGKRDLTHDVQKTTDFCVSSLPLKSVSIPVVEVSALLSEGDLEKIRNYIARFERTATENLPAQDFALEMEQVQLVVQDIQHVLKHFAMCHVENTVTFEQLLPEISMKITQDIDKSETLTKEFWARERMATQVFGVLGFALIHTRSQAVSRPVFQVWCSGVPFQAAYFQGISVVFAMVVPEDEHQTLHTDLMGCISTALIEDDRLLASAKAGDSGALENLLAYHLKQFFHQYLTKFTDGE